MAREQGGWLCQQHHSRAHGHTAGRVSRVAAARLGTWALQDASSDGFLPSWWLREVFSHAFLARVLGVTFAKEHEYVGVTLTARRSSLGTEPCGPAREPRQAVLTVSWAGAASGMLGPRGRAGSARPAATRWCHVSPARMAMGGPGPRSGASGQRGLLVGAQLQRSPAGAPRVNHRPPTPWERPIGCSGAQGSHGGGPWLPWCRAHSLAR